MHNVMPTQNAKSLYDLRKIEQSRAFREVALLFEQLLECASIAILVHKIVNVGSFEYIEVFDDMLTRLERAKDVDLIVGTLLQFGYCLNFKSSPSLSLLTVSSLCLSP